MQLPEGLRDALGQVIADQRREWRRERELIQAESRQLIAELRAEIVELRGKVDARLAELKDGQPGERGEPGPRGEPGAPGKLPPIGAWEDRVYRESDVVAFGGAVYQAQRDTGKAPPHDDWQCIVTAGKDGNDGRSLNPRSTWSAGETYARLDVVALDGGAFVARRDEPGPCPGDGWQLIAQRGKPGRPGDRGAGLKGDAGPAVVAIDIDGNGIVTVTNADGTTAQGDFYPVLSKLVR